MSKTNSGKIYRDDAVPGELIMAKANSNKNKKKPVILYMTDAIADFMLDGTEDMTEEDIEAQRVYKAKAEEIFRKNYEKEADRILSKIYNKDYMNSTEKQFAAQSQSTIEELMKVQQKMGQEASLTPERAQLIASEIIERITNDKKKQLKNNK